MSIQQAIEKAIKGGWNAKTIPHDKTCENIATHGDILLDPLFWQALGKSMGWKETKFYPFTSTHPHIGEYMPEWKWYWNQLINCLYLGGTIESYFEKL